MGTVVLFEKSSVKKEAEKVLPPGMQLVALSGHMLAYKRPDEIAPETLAKIFVGQPPALPYDGPWRYDNLPFVVARPPYEIGKNRDGKSHRDAVMALRDRLKEADTVIVATDPGREGSLIAWELLQFAGYKGKVLRMKLGATDARSISKAYEDCVKGGAETGERDYCRFMEGLARQMQDYHSGMNGTRCMNIAFPRAKEDKRYSFGEVIMRVLGLLAELEDEIANFKPETFHKIAMDVDQDGVRGRLVHMPDPLLKDEKEAARIAGVAKGWKGPLSVKGVDRASGPPSLFSGAKMFKEAAARFG
ncbi:MAG: type IA DNA topoisomerase, partial [Azospirillum sp.]|nr:type IA DNA topoisomerase [Azospirillum sp.]